MAPLLHFTLRQSSFIQFWEGSCLLFTVLGPHKSRSVISSEMRSAATGSYPDRKQSWPLMKSFQTSRRALQRVSTGKGASVRESLCKRRPSTYSSANQMYSVQGESHKNISNIILLIGWRFLHVRVLLHRPTILRFCQTMVSASRSFSSGAQNHFKKDENLRSRVNVQSSVICVTTAIDLISSLHDSTTESCDGAWWYTTFCRCISSFYICSDS